VGNALLRPARYVAQMCETPISATTGMQTPMTNFRQSRSTGRWQAFAILAATLLALTAAPGGATAASKVARCLIVSGGSVNLRGRCLFSTEGRDGSFTVENTSRRGALFGSVLSVSVTMIGRGVAEVRGLTRQGINSRWGTARRSARRPACWVGADFSVCAWGL